MSRTIVVGDVHGCAAELDMLLEKLGVTGDDQLHFVGDLVARGPNTRAVLRRVRALGARAVMGNHELRLLEARAARRG
ncbi:MAG TPA: metallophosphoesterase, partial [Polyangiaceae bacterium]|nr:metallophosphoesterase [Polyangiaceae bacterium]